MLYKQITALATLSASATPERPGSSGNILIGEPIEAIITVVATRS